MRIQDIVGQLLNTYSYSPWHPGRRELSLNIKRGIEYRRFFYNLSWQEQNKETLKSLQETVDYARRNVPYYADKLRGLPSDFPQSLADYRTLEPLNKVTVRTKKNALLSQEFKLSRLIACSTSGSTGEPTVVYSAQQDVGWRLAGEQYYYALLGCPRGKRVGKLYGGEVEISNLFSSFRQVKDWAFNRLHYDCLKLDEEYLIKVHANFTKFAPDIVIAYSSAIYLLALALERRRIRPAYPRQVILCAAEKLENYQRAVVERVFAVPVVERYGSRDIGQMAFQLPAQSSDLQVDRCYCLIEPDGQPDENGRAPLLVTTLRNRAMPLLRYQIEDLAGFPANWTPDQVVFSLSEIVGRTCDYILLPGNKKVSGGMIDILLQDKDVNAYQVVQYADASVCVKIVPGPKLKLAERTEIQRLICAHLAGVAVKFEYPVEIERTTAHAKLRPVISHLALPPQSPVWRYSESDVFSAL